MVQQYKTTSNLLIRFVFIILTMMFLGVNTFAQQDTEAGEYLVGVELIAEGLVSPVDMAMPNDGTNRMFVVDQAGTIRIVAADGSLLPEPFLDLTDKIVPLDAEYDERGVLGLAFHPDYANNGRFFVYYTIPLHPDAPADWNHTNRVSEFHVSADNPDMADPASERVIWEHDHPAMNHNAGHIAFGHDGYLYIPYGDGGGADDSGLGHTPDIGNGQDTSNLFGTIMRIDVNTGDTGNAYNIPADNPFVGDDNIPDEIYAYGFRNPFDIAFDEEGRLFVADAGQNLYEEINMVQIGGNYGWNIKEGSHCFDVANPDNPPADCAAAGTVMGDPLIDPIVEYSHEYGIVVVGGRMYHANTLPDLTGYLIFADYAASRDNPTGVLFWAEPSATGDLWEWGELQVAGMENNRVGAYILAIAQDQAGEIYVLTKENSGPTGNTGKVWKLVPAEMPASS
jgi:glucose/arabinose dehydrogenase